MSTATTTSTNNKNTKTPKATATKFESDNHTDLRGRGRHYNEQDPLYAKAVDNSTGEMSKFSMDGNESAELVKFRQETLMGFTDDFETADAPKRKFVENTQTSKQKRKSLQKAKKKHKKPIKNKAKKKPK